MDAVLQPRVRVAPATVGLGVERERPELGEAARPLLLRCSETRSVCASHTVISLRTLARSSVSRTPAASASCDGSTTWRGGRWWSSQSHTNDVARRLRIEWATVVQPLRVVTTTSTRSVCRARGGRGGGRSMSSDDMKRKEAPAAARFFRIVHKAKCTNRVRTPLRSEDARRPKEKRAERPSGAPP